MEGKDGTGKKMKRRSSQRLQAHNKYAHDKYAQYKDDHGNNKEGKIQLKKSMIQEAKYVKHST